MKHTNFDIYYQFLFLWFSSLSSFTSASTNSTILCYNCNTNLNGNGTNHTNPVCIIPSPDVKFLEEKIDDSKLTHAFNLGYHENKTNFLGDHAIKSKNQRKMEKDEFEDMPLSEENLNETHHQQDEGVWRKSNRFAEKYSDYFEFGNPVTRRLIIYLNNSTNSSLAQRSEMVVT